MGWPGRARGAAGGAGGRRDRAGLLLGPGAGGGAGGAGGPAAGGDRRAVPHPDAVPGAAQRAVPSAADGAGARVAEECPHRTLVRAGHSNGATGIRRLVTDPVRRVTDLVLTGQGAMVPGPMDGKSSPRGRHRHRADPRGAATTDGSPQWSPPVSRPHRTPSAPQWTGAASTPEWTPAPPAPRPESWFGGPDPSPAPRPTPTSDRRWSTGAADRPAQSWS